MNLNGGDIRIVSEDDGINVAGGTDDTQTTQAPTDRFGGDNFSGSNRWLYINGGTITIIAEGDGIDVNGNSKMTGGTVYVSGPTRTGNGALDYDGTFEIDGGTLVTADSGGMSQTTSASSSQPSLLISFTSAVAAGTEVSLKDSSGNIVDSFTPEKQFQVLMFSSPNLKLNGSYTLVLVVKNLLQLHCQR